MRNIDNKTKKKIIIVAVILIFTLLVSITIFNFYFSEQSKFRGAWRKYNTNEVWIFLNDGTYMHFNLSTKEIITVDTWHVYPDGWIIMDGDYRYEFIDNYRVEIYDSQTNFVLQKL